MKIRILSAVVGVPLVLLALAFHSVFPLCINIVCAVASLLCTVELLKAKNVLNNYEISAPFMLFSAIFPVMTATQYWGIFAYIIIFYIFTILILKSKKYNFEDIAYLMTAGGLSTVGFSCMANSYIFDPAKSCFYITLCIGIPWIADAGAYFVGVAMGKHKLCPNISPKKTIEGAIGGVIIGALGALGVALFFQYVIFGDKFSIDLIGLLIMGFVGTFISIIGDLTFSLVKRNCKVKDYGNIIPGHGGILDRCDSVIMTAPFIFIFVQYWQIVSAV